MQFHCLVCKSELTLFAKSPELEGNSKDGYLECPNCTISTPIVNGIKFFNETDISIHSDPYTETDRIKSNIESKRNDYEKFISAKISKGLVDPYSAFQPFNESSRAFYPFINLLVDKVLKPGDVILDTWCRTGWSGYFLASMFPEQHVISIWEGNQDVLGYQGFDFWYSEERRPKNLEIVYHDLGKKLPIEDNAIKFVYGLDTLHRYDQSVLVSELLRVTSEDGVIIWPHIHLTNSDPAPFFERGERQLHGLDYQRFFDRVLRNKSKKAYVLSEPAMFSLSSEQILESTPDTVDYNAIIAVLPESLIGSTLAPFCYENEDFNRLYTLVNPYLKIDLNNQNVVLDPEHLNGVVGVMLDRHPIYHRKIEGAHNYRLSELQTKIIYLAENGYSNSEIIHSLRITENDFFEAVKQLSEVEIVHILPLVANAVNLQQFHGAKRAPSAPFKHTLTQQRTKSGKSFTSQAVIINDEDGSELFYNDTSFLIENIQSLLLEKTSPGDCLFVCSKPHFESVLVFWAASEIGLNVCILNTEMPIKMKLELENELLPKFVFLDKQLHNEFAQSSTSKIVVFDEEDSDSSDILWFSEWMENTNGEASFAKKIIKPDFIAATLFTSGTTGKPKGIKLSHSSLYRSGELLSQFYQWNSDDKLLMVSELDSMSGLRNVCIATQFAGVTIVIPKYSSDSPKIFSIVETIANHQVTLLSTTPALIRQFIQLGERIKRELKSVRQVICTGGALPVKVAEKFSEIFGIEIIDYYGLTETTGLCISNPSETSHEKAGSIGLAVKSVAQIVSPEGELMAPGEVGRLRIYNDRLMSGYMNPHEASNLSVMDGWLYTGDLAYMDNDGYFYLKGREREIIKDHSGNVIYLSEVENCLLESEYVSEAVVCSVIIDDIEYLGAFLIETVESPKDLASKLKSYVAEKLGPNKAPYFIKFMEKLPETIRGTIDKKSLIATYLNETSKG
ncbi:class I adenylate-forming enzyme family protein [Ekhidna sp.]